MKKIALLAAFVCLGAGAFAQVLQTSLKDAVILKNKTEVSFSETKSYFYLLADCNLQISKTDGVFYVSEFYAQDTLNGGEPEDDYNGQLDFSFTPVKTEKGLALKITSKVADRDGLNLKGSSIQVIEDEQGVKVVFKVKGTWKERQEHDKVFDVLVPASSEVTSVRPPLSQEKLSAAVVRNLKQHFHPAEK